MMPPMNGTPGHGKDRERSTWLSEDEEVWGTTSAAGIGVIGRLDAEDEADDRTEIRTHVLAASPRARAAAAKQASTDTSRESTADANN
jgi:hypothetical protein